MRGAVVWGIIVLSVWLAACQSDARPITENEAKEIALRHLGLVAASSSIERILAGGDGENWTVLVIFWPPAPGLHTMLAVSRDGKILQVWPGM